MGFPAGMQLATIAFGIPLTATGKDVVTKVSVKPTSRVIWAATGQPLPEFSDSFTAAAGQLGSFQVPFVNQAGFIDSTGATVTDFAYQVTASWEFGNERPITWSKNLKPLVGQTGTIDLDLVPDGPVSIPVTAPTAAVLGFHGRTGFITIQESDLPTRLSVGELAATYASKWKTGSVYVVGDKVLNPSGDIVTANVNHTASAAYATDAAKWDLSTSYLKRGHTDYLTPTAPMVELATTAGSGRIFHLLSGAGSTSEIAGVGVDNDNSSGFVFSLKAKNNIGIGVNLETTSGSDSIGILGSGLSTGKVVELRKGSQNGGTLVSLRADYGGTGNLLQWGLPGATVASTLTVTGSTVTATGHGMVAGQRLTFSAITGTTGITNGTTYYVAGTVTANTFQVAASLGGAAITFGGVNGTANYVAADNLNGYIDAADGSLNLQSGNTNQSKIRASVVPGGTQEAHYAYSGTPGLWFPNAVASASNSFKFQQGNAAAIGSETMVTLIELKNTNAIGFYGATPVTKPALTYSRATENAAQAQIRTALAALGLVTDSTVA